jgi:hypothetical protein
VLRVVLGIEALLLEGLEVGKILHASATAEVGETVQPEVEHLEVAMLAAPQAPTYFGNGDYDI